MRSDRSAERRRSRYLPTLYPKGRWDMEGGDLIGTIVTVVGTFLGTIFMGLIGWVTSRDTIAQQVQDSVTDDLQDQRDYWEQQTEKWRRRHQELADRLDQLEERNDALDEKCEALADFIDEHHEELPDDLPVS